MLMFVMWSSSRAPRTALSRALSRDLGSTQPELVHAFLVEAERVTELVVERRADLVAQLGARARGAFQVALEEEDGRRELWGRGTALAERRTDRGVLEVARRAARHLERLGMLVRWLQELDSAGRPASNGHT